MSDATPLAAGFRADLDRMEAADLHDTPLPASHVGASPPATWVRRCPLPRHRMEPERTAVELVEESVRRIGTDDEEVRAWAHLDRASALAEARVADLEILGDRRRGPLHGIPVGVKDIIDVAGMPTGAGSAFFRGPSRRRVPDTDAGVVALLREAGAIVLGKTHTHEFAFGGTTPPTRNPADVDRITGGSSGGSAAAVAAGHVRVALGTDTGGSVRIPSAYCGVASLVPGPGLPLDGVLPLAWSMDRVGVIAADVPDLVASCHALGVTGEVPREPTFAGVRIGVPAGTFDGAVDEDVVTAVRAALARAEAAGATVREVEVPHQWAAVAAGLTLILAEGAEAQRARRATGEELFGQDVRGMLAMADKLSAGTYVRAQRIRHLLRAELLAVLTEVDLLATPTLPNVAPLAEEVGDGQLTAGSVRIGIADSHLRYNIAANLAALPCGSQALPRDRPGLPVGLEWVAAPGRDATVLAAMIAMDATR